MTKPTSHSLFSKNWNSIDDLSNIYQRYKDSKKFAKEINKATYLLLRFFSFEDLVNKINNAPIVGNNIKEDKIGKLIS